MKILSSLSIVFLLNIWLPSQVNAQDMKMELEMACLGDIELSNAVIKVIQREAVANGQLTEQEVLQVKTLLAENSVVSLDSTGQFKAIMEACIAGNIFQERNAGLLGSQ